jgi:phosphoesterase RecJ-like protein
MTTEMLTLDCVCARILAAKRPIILSHARPDGDTVGTAEALAHLFSALGTRAAWACADPCPRRLAFLFDECPLATREENERGCVIAVDVASPAQLGALAERYAGRVDFSIDHHASCTPFAPTYLSPTAAAAGEILYEIAARLVEMGALSAIPRPFAAAAYAALSSDTGCFRYANVTPRTHEVAAALLLAGADADRINHLLFECRTESELRASAIAAENLSLHAGGRVGIVLLSLAARTGLSDEDFETAIDVPRSVAGVEIAAAIREMAGGACRVSLRSAGADVAAVAASFGGGGHKRAAGCTVAGTPDEVLKTILPALTAALL